MPHVLQETERSSAQERLRAFEQQTLLATAIGLKRTASDAEASIGPGGRLPLGAVRAPELAAALQRRQRQYDRVRAAALGQPLPDPLPAAPVDAGPRLGAERGGQPGHAAGRADAMDLAASPAPGSARPGSTPGPSGLDDGGPGTGVGTTPADDPGARGDRLDLADASDDPDTETQTTVYAGDVADPEAMAAAVAHGGDGTAAGAGELEPPLGDYGDVGAVGLMAGAAAAYDPRAPQPGVPQHQPPTPDSMGGLPSGITPTPTGPYDSLSGAIQPHAEEEWHDV